MLRNRILGEIFHPNDLNRSILLLITEKLQHIIRISWDNWTLLHISLISYGFSLFDPHRETADTAICWAVHASEEVLSPWSNSLRHREC